MKIHPDQIRATEQEQARARRAAEADAGFGDLLAREVGKTREQDAAQPAAPPPGAGLSTMVLAAQAAAGVGENTDSGQSVMDSLDTLMNEWEEYAARLQEPSASLNLRQANGVLEHIERGVASIKDRYPGLGDEAPGLQAVVDEMEILAVTERIKFNRGDYLA
ncbi:hypothetical protein [Desulfocurvus sp.]|jgi:hypothetical protein|uniref:hypothetical protein n=1 Tax=Desulfocurvus sp. TaxID=2871698 RepID=UPI0025C577D8|nr:hypothetical protein [Desulfocurvus sp.]MCK9240704.1 hypothetical protein [Desulfocurvus sp.]